MSLDKKERGLIRKRIYIMILPILIENILELSAGFVLMGMIGRISTVAVSALGISIRITQILWALFKGIATGASIFVAQSYGAKEQDRLRNTVQQTLLSMVMLAVVLAVAVNLNARFLLSVFNPDPAIMESAVIYLKTVCMGLPFMAVMLVVAGSLQGTGNARTPMLIALMMNVVNIGTGFCLIFGRLGLPALGVRGAALATVAGQLFGALLGLAVLFRRGGILGGLGRKFFCLDYKEILSVYRVGMPTAMESIFWQIAAIILTRTILSFGDVPFAAHQLGMQAESISYLPAAGFGVASTAFIGQMLGARDYPGAKTYFKEIMTGVCLITLVSALTLVLFPGPIMGLLTDDSRVIELGSVYLVMMGIVQIPQNLSFVLNGALRGAGYTKIPMAVSAIGLWGIRVPLTLVLTYGFHFNILAVWAVLGVDLFVRFTLSIILFKSKNIYQPGKVSLVSHTIRQ